MFPWLELLDHSSIEQKESSSKCSFSLFQQSKQRKLQNTSLIKSLTFEKLEYEYLDQGVSTPCLDSVYDINGIESFN